MTIAPALPPVLPVTFISVEFEQPTSIICSPNKQVGSSFFGLMIPIKSGMFRKLCSRFSMASNGWGSSGMRALKCRGRTSLIFSRKGWFAIKKKSNGSWQAVFAYRDYARTEELQSQREQAEKRGEAFVYDRQWMAESDAQAKAFEAEGRTAVVRLKMPREGQCQFHDGIRGDVSFDWANEQDHVIQRQDGTCLYHLASVVDDFDYKITHVVRAVEHLPNTPRQIFIAQSLGYPLPIYAHLPYVAEPAEPPN